MTIATIVADLAAGTVIGLGGLPRDDAATDTDVSASHAVKYRYTNMKATISTSSRLTCAVATGTDINGTYLYFADNWATVTKLDALHPLVVSDMFSGCAFKVYRGGSAFVAAHIARPDGTSADANVTLLADYARQKGWTEVQHVSSSGVVGVGGATTVAMACQLLGASVDTIRLGLNGQGVAVSRLRVTTPI